jgi:hypothetical protein
VGSKTYLTLIQNSIPYGYDQKHSAHANLCALDHSMRSNSRRLDCAYVHSITESKVVSFHNHPITAYLVLRQNERDMQNRYPEPLLVSQLMDLVTPLDNSTFGQIKIKYQSLMPEVVT